MRRRPSLFAALLFNEGFVYQYSARASALVVLLRSVWLTPTASYSNQVMMTEVVTRAIEAREHTLATGSAEKWSSEQTESVGRPWSFNASLGKAVGAFSFGIAPIMPVSREMMLQLRSAGAAPEVGECHFAFPSNCFPRSSTDGMFAVGDEVSETDREAACSTLAS